MVELHQCLLDIFQHGDVDFPLVVVPVKVNAEVLFAGPSMGYGVIIFKDSNEVLRMSFTHIFDAIIVHVKREADWACGVCPETWGKFVLLTPLFV